jgi:RecA/RadA recombinase
MSFIRTLIKDLPAITTIAADGLSSSEFDGFVNTGSYTLNAALSGSLFGGMPNNKITVFAGDPATGKSFFVLGIVKQWLHDNPEGNVIYFDTESAVTNQMLSERGIDLTRLVKSEPETIEQFRQTALRILDRYDETSVKSRQPLLMVLDSLSNLSSSKEVEDIRNEKDTRDMTKAGLIRGTFRVLRLRLSKLKVPLICTNHVYAAVSAYMPTKILSGGAGIIYVSDSIAMLSKSKDRDKDKNIIGSIVKAKMFKSRLSRENSEVEVRISYAGGLDKYYGLLEMFVEAGLVQHSGGKYTFPGGKSVFAGKIQEAPEKFFTDEFLKELNDKYVGPNFSYGTIANTPTHTSADDTDAEHDE